MRQLVVIPARYASTRLPAKPLISIGGQPMIVRTYRQCLAVAAPDDIIVATDDERIYDVCSAAGAQVMMTSSECLTGTDRVAEVARSHAADCYINVQGDEPIMPPADIKRIMTAAAQTPDQVINGYCEIPNQDVFLSRDTIKCAITSDGRLLYASRAPIPAGKSSQLSQAWRQICVYSFPPRALQAFAENRTKTRLEEAEDIEILRFVELGYDVRMVAMSNGSIAVDRPADVDRVEEAIAAQQLTIP